MGGRERHGHRGRQRLPVHEPGAAVGAAMSDERRRYLAYLVRFADASTSGPPHWRVSVEEAQTGQRRGFANLESLCRFFAEQLSDRDDQPGRPPDRNHPRAATEGGDPWERPSQTDDHGMD